MRILIIALAPSLALAEGLSQSPAYQECTQLAQNNPEKALEKSAAWLKFDDSAAALHCRAMALFSAKQYAEAGEMLEKVRDKIPADDITLQTYITKQAAKAWLAAQKADAALRTLTQQVDRMGRTKTDNVTAAKLSSELLLERATIHQNYGQLSEAVKALDQAMSLTPLNIDILLLRATVFQQLGDFPLSLEDTRAVLKLDPKNETAKQLLKKLGEKK